MELSLCEVAFGLLLAGLAIAIAVADLRSMLIPDMLNLALATGGLGLILICDQAAPWTGLAFALLIMAGFMGLRAWYLSTRGIAGLGLGDVKMAGAGALWYSPWNLPLFLLATCTAALAYAAFLHLRRGSLTMESKIPFGPFIAFGLFTAYVMERTGVPTFIPVDM